MIADFESILKPVNQASGEHSIKKDATGTGTSTGLRMLSKSAIIENGAST